MPRVWRCQQTLALMVASELRIQRCVCPQGAPCLRAGHHPLRSRLAFLSFGRWEHLAQGDEMTPKGTQNQGLAALLWAPPTLPSAQRTLHQRSATGSFISAKSLPFLPSTASSAGWHLSTSFGPPATALARPTSSLPWPPSPHLPLCCAPAQPSHSS